MLAYLKINVNNFCKNFSKNFLFDKKTCILYNKDRKEVYSNLTESINLDTLIAGTTKLKYIELYIHYHTEEVVYKLVE